MSNERSLLTGERNEEVVSEAQTGLGTWRRDKCLIPTWLPPFSIQEVDLKPFISPTRRNLSLLSDFFTPEEALLHSQPQLH